MTSSSYFAKRVSWADAGDDEVESEYLIGGRTRGIEGHLRGGGGPSKASGLVAFITHLSFLGILVISALLINSYVSSVQHPMFEVLSIVGIVISCVVCVSSLLCLCGLYTFDAHSTRLLLLGHACAWSCVLLQLTYGGLIAAYWDTRAMPNLFVTSPERPPSPTVLLQWNERHYDRAHHDEHAERAALPVPVLQPRAVATPSSRHLLSVPTASSAAASSSVPLSAPAAATTSITQLLQKLISLIPSPFPSALTDSDSDSETHSESAPKPTAAPAAPAAPAAAKPAHDAVKAKAVVAPRFAAVQQKQQQQTQTQTQHTQEKQTQHQEQQHVKATEEAHTQAQISPVSNAQGSYASRTTVGILTIAALVTLVLCVTGLTAVNWPVSTQLRVIRTNLTLAMLGLLGVSVAILALNIITLVDPPAALGIAYDDVSSWSVYGVGATALGLFVVAILLIRLIFMVGQEQDLNVLHTRLSRRTPATSSASTLGTVSSRAGRNVGIVSTRSENSAARYQRALSSLHTVMFLLVPLTAAMVTLTVYTYDLALPSIAEYPQSQLLLVSSILGWTTPVFNFLVWMTCFQWRKRILEYNDSDIYSKHSRVYEPIV